MEKIINEINLLNDIPLNIDYENVDRHTEEGSYSGEIDIDTENYSLTAYVTISFIKTSTQYDYLSPEEVEIEDEEIICYSVKVYENKDFEEIELSEKDTKDLENAIIKLINKSL